MGRGGFIGWIFARFDDAALAAAQDETFTWQESGDLELLEKIQVEPPGGRGSDASRYEAMGGRCGGAGSWSEASRTPVG
jgi:hypothetical protein